MIVRKSTCDDLPVLTDLYREAREIQLESGNLNQWAEGYPSEEIIMRDITDGNGYIIEDDGRVVGAFALIFGEDPTYKVIYDGSWIEDTAPYATIHRLGSFKSSKGVAAACFEWCWGRIHNLRVDTHKDNLIMRHCIEKAGFSYCGIIHLLNGDERLAFQKISGNMSGE